MDTSGAACGCNMVETHSDPTRRLQNWETDKLPPGANRGAKDPANQAPQNFKARTPTVRNI